MEERDQMAAVLYTALVEVVVTKRAKGTELQNLSNATREAMRAEFTEAARLSLVAADVFHQIKEQQPGATSE